MIAEDDRGFTLGDGLFETLLVKEGRPILLPEHLDRMAGAATALRLPEPPLEEIVRLAEEAAAGQARAALRITWSVGPGGRGLDRPASPAPRLVVSATPSASPTGPARVAISDIRRHSASPAARHKTLSYIDNVLARREAAERGLDEALMLDEHGRVACAAAANVFWISGGRLETPPLEGPVLPGVMRAKVLAAARALGLPAAELSHAPERLANVEGMFLTNSLIGLRAVSRLEDRELADHPWRRRFAEALADVT